MNFGNFCTRAGLSRSDDCQRLYQLQLNAKHQKETKLPERPDDEIKARRSAPPRSITSSSFWRVVLLCSFVSGIWSVFHAQFVWNYNNQWFSGTKNAIFEKCFWNINYVIFGFSPNWDQPRHATEGCQICDLCLLMLHSIILSGVISPVRSCLGFFAQCCTACCSYLWLPTEPLPDTIKNTLNQNNGIDSIKIQTVIIYYK